MSKPRTITSGESSLLYQDSTRFGFQSAHPRNDLPEFDICFSFPLGTTFDTFYHFHQDKLEYLVVEKGSIRVTINGRIFTADASAGQIEIPKMTPHRWECLGEEETTVWERTVPADGRAEAFFRNLVSLINDHGGMPPPLQAFKLFADLDNYPIGEAKWMAGMTGVIVVATNAVARVAGMMGYKAMYEEYTPKKLMDRVSAAAGNS